jgi:quercetin dioxygenase-like cupin family protein
MAYSADYREHTKFNPDKFSKTTLFQSKQLMLGLNCFESGQTQQVHTHTDQDKFYYVIEGEGEFVVGGDTFKAGIGVTIWAAAGSEHGVTNTGDQRLVLLVGIAPAPGS